MHSSINSLVTAVWALIADCASYRGLVFKKNFRISAYKDAAFSSIDFHCCLYFCSKFNHSRYGDPVIQWLSRKQRTKRWQGMQVRSQMMQSPLLRAQLEKLWLIVNRLQVNGLLTNYRLQWLVQIAFIERIKLLSVVMVKHHSTCHPWHRFLSKTFQIVQWNYSIMTLHLDLHQNDQGRKNASIKNLKGLYCLMGGQSWTYSRWSLR